MKTILQDNLPEILRFPLVVVCNDAGAANLIYAWLRSWKRLGFFDKKEVRLLIEGPALQAWTTQKNTLLNFILYPDIHSAFRGVNCVLTGTGWSSNLEHNARKEALLRQIPSIGVIDHWVNYHERFERSGELILPNNIWVSDKTAANYAKKIFEDIPITILPNLYLKEIVSDIPPVPDYCKNLLYLLEPIRETWDRGELGEFQALDYFIENRKLIIGEEKVNIILKLHPSELYEKYDNWILNNNDINITLTKDITLSEAIGKSRWVVGAETFGLIIALEAKRIVWSSLPPWAHECRLRHESLKHLRDYNSID